MADRDLTIAVSGAGGSGVVSVGELLLQAWAAAGGRGLLRKAFGPQVRGGEAAALVKLCADESYTAAATCDLLLALDWNHFERFGEEIRLRADSMVICADPDEVPPTLRALGPTIIACRFKELAHEAHSDGRANMLALGLLVALLELDPAPVTALALERLSGKAPAYRDAATACIAAGVAAAPALPLAPPPRPGGNPWCLSGNQAAAYAVLRAGVRFVAAYPITPASDALEYLAAPLERLGGTLVQAEDELGAINMVLGAAYGGVPAFTATSGPGLALMSESIGLAVASETPATILNVMRGGPSTGIPTKSEQSDLNIALHGTHGDAPHIVVAPLSVADCVFTAGWAVQLAERYQTPAIILSDQFLGQSTAIVSAPREALEATADEPAAPGVVAAAEEPAAGPYLRYRLTESGLSPRSVPGDPDCRYTADGLEHNPRGTPSASAEDHAQQLAKRRRKLLDVERSPDWGERQGAGAIGLLCFGSASAAVRVAAQQLSTAGMACRTISLRLLAPLPVGSLAEALDGCDELFVVEQNHGAQLLRYLRAELALAGAVHSIARPGPVPLAAAEIRDAVQEVLSHE